jgi:hypothetical protein
MGVEEQITQLELEIQRFQRNFSRYFVGDLDLPPLELQGRIDRRLRELHNTRIRRSIDQFRLSGLEARYGSYREMFERRLRNHEEGRGGKTRPAIAAKPRLDAQQGVVVDKNLDRDAVSVLYQGLYSQRGSGVKNKIDPDRFGSYLAQQMELIRKKTGCHQVQFRVQNEGGKLKLKAKPISAEKSQRGDV